MKRGIVLGGGGSRGPYEIGFWQALRELEIPYHIVTGTSVGALNGVLMVQGCFHKGRDMWLKLSNSDIISGLPEDPETPEEKPRLYGSFIRSVVEQGGMDTAPLEKTLERVIDEELFRRSPIEYALVTVQFPTFRPVTMTKEQIPQGRLIDYLLASCACFPAFRQREIDGQKFIDGSYHDVMPVNLALDCGAEEIVSVDLHSPGLRPQVKKDCPITTVHSYWDLGIFLAFDPVAARKNMSLGYQDTMKAYRRLEGSAYAFHLGETPRNALLMRSALVAIYNRLRSTLLRRGDTTNPAKHLALYRLQSSLQLQTGVKFGRAVTTCGEVAGEILQVDPARIYSFRQFNRALLAAIDAPESTGATRHIPLKTPAFSPHASRKIMLWLLKALRSGYYTGEVPRIFWSRAALAPRETMAAAYLLALEIDKSNR